jgi:hypothetical protein
MSRSESVGGMTITLGQVGFVIVADLQLADKSAVRKLWTTCEGLFSAFEEPTTKLECSSRHHYRWLYLLRPALPRVKSLDSRGPVPLRAYRLRSEDKPTCRRTVVATTSA